MPSYLASMSFVVVRSHRGPDDRASGAWISPEQFFEAHPVGHHDAYIGRRTA